METTNKPDKKRTLSRRVRNRLGPLISRFGKRIGSDRLVYNRLIFQAFHETGLESAPAVIRSFRQMFPDVRRCVDVGAGSGAYSAEAMRAGWEMVALERSPLGRKWARKQGVDCRNWDLTAEPPFEGLGTFDLAFSFEVAEHLPPALGDRLVEVICGLAPLVVFSAAQVGQGGTDHINEQPIPYWIERFERAGMRYDDARTQELRRVFIQEDMSAWWLQNNVSIYVRP